MPPAYLRGPETMPVAEARLCAGKVRFGTAALAHSVARTRRHMKANGAGPRMWEREVYRCAECGGWHLSGAPTRR